VVPRRRLTSTSCSTTGTGRAHSWQQAGQHSPAQQAQVQSPTHWQLPVSQQPQQFRVAQVPPRPVGTTTETKGAATRAAQSNAIFMRRLS
jgi:hypothetical protein